MCVLIAATWPIVPTATEHPLWKAGAKRLALRTADTAVPRHQHQRRMGAKERISKGHLKCVDTSARRIERSLQQIWR